MLKHALFVFSRSGLVFFKVVQILIHYGAEPRFGTDPEHVNLVGIMDLVVTGLLTECGGVSIVVHWRIGDAASVWV